MYQPPHFREERLTVLHDLIRAHPLAAIVTLAGDGFEANHIPFLVDRARGPFGTLRAHVARANPLARLGAAGVPALAIFQGPERYISPGWYETKRESGKVVPTWNYAVVHAHGTLRVMEDNAFLGRQIADITDQQEAGRAHAWAVTDAPPDYLAGQMKGIIGIELEILRLEGKWKVSQNRNEADRAGVIEGLRSDQGPDDPMATLVEKA